MTVNVPSSSLTAESTNARKVFGKAICWCGKLFLGLALTSTPLQSHSRAGETEPKTPGLFQMEWKRESWMTALGINALHCTILPDAPLFGGTLVLEVWEPWDTNSPVFSESFVLPRFKKKTHLAYEFTLYFYPPKLRDILADDHFPSSIEIVQKRGTPPPGEIEDETESPAYLLRKQVKFPESYAAAGESSAQYSWDRKAITDRLPVFHMFANATKFATVLEADVATTRRANPYITHVVGWFEAVTEPAPQPAATRSNPKSTIEADNSPRTTLLPVGKPAPAWDLPNVNGGRIASDTYRGKIQVWNFWATWCGPCVSELPTFVELQKQYGDKEVQFVGFSLDSQISSSELALFCKRRLLNYPVVQLSKEVQTNFGITGVPATFVIESNGIVQLSHSGQISQAALETEISKYIR